MVAVVPVSAAAGPASAGPARPTSPATATAAPAAATTILRMAISVLFVVVGTRFCADVYGRAMRPPTGSGDRRTWWGTAASGDGGTGVAYQLAVTGSAKDQSRQ